MYRVAAIFIAIIFFGFAFKHYLSVLDKNAELKTSLERQQHEMTRYIDKVKRMQEISDKQTNNLRVANAEIDKLESDLRDNTKRLRIKTVCPVGKAASVDDARSAELASDAEQNYLRLRRELETLEAQFLGLREYVNSLD